MVPPDILCNKLKHLNINPYIYNWIISFLSNRTQRVKVDGVLTEFLDVNRGVAQRTILGPILFSVMVNDIKVIDPTCSLLGKFADDLTLSVPIRNGKSDISSLEVLNVKKWAEENRMKLNLNKTWEMVLRGKTHKPLPDPLPLIQRRD